MQGPVADHIDAILNFIFDHGALTEFEKTHASDAIMNGVEFGRAPTKSEEFALRKAFGREQSKGVGDLIANREFGKLALEIASIPRAIMASFDFGAGLRQGIMFGV